MYVALPPGWGRNIDHRNEQLSWIPSVYKITINQSIKCLNLIMILMNFIDYLMKSILYQVVSKNLQEFLLLMLYFTTKQIFEKTISNYHKTKLKLKLKQRKPNLIINKKHSENVNTSTSMTFDMWPWPYTKAKNDCHRILANI